ncbi:hypothetical protein, partial [Roseomonas rosulenta]|uniref:hypothetical protein n=1 Tax=Roseomonas rosulenta TaxID=2748667 RepID=UPI0018E02FA1
TPAAVPPRRRTPAAEPSPSPAPIRVSESAERLQGEGFLEASSYWILATLLDQPYGAFVFENAANSDDWEVDLVWLIDALDRLDLG